MLSAAWSNRCRKFRFSSSCFTFASSVAFFIILLVLVTGPVVSKDHRNSWLTNFLKVFNDNLLTFIWKIFFAESRAKLWHILLRKLTGKKLFWALRLVVVSTKIDFDYSSCVFGNILFNYLDCSSWHICENVMK